MEFILESDIWKLRACQVLTVKPTDDSSKIQYKYHCRMLQYHPDNHPDEPLAHELSALINEAYGLLRGRISHPSLLKKDELVQKLVDAPFPAEGVPTYSAWLKEQFYNADDGSIWAY